MISVIVPIYKVESYLRQCVESILRQSYSDLEIILIDDGSPDKCGEICDEYAQKDARIRVYHTENKGISAARNVGLDVATGDFIGFVDSDDWIEPNMYEVLLYAIIQNNADVSVCGSWYEFLSTSKDANVIKNNYFGKDCLKFLVEGKIRNAVWNKLYRRSLFESIRFPEGRSFEDLAIMHQVFSRVNLMVSTDCLLYHYRQRTSSIVKDYSARNLIDLANAYIDRFEFLREQEYDVYLACEDYILSSTAGGLSKLWRWWHKNNYDEKKRYMNNVKEYLVFIRSHYSLFGKRSWPFFLKISVFFMHSDSKLSFSLIYYLNQFYRRIRPKHDEYTD
jgi:glycosyltransferase involved in cell wall biosynthesis